MQGLIIYETRYGATRQYAGWLARDMHIPIVTAAEANADQVGITDYLVIGTPVYYGRFRISKWMRQNLALIRDKKIFMFVVTATSSGEEETRNRFIKASLPAILHGKVEICFVPGRLVHKDLSWADRIALKIASMTLRDKEKRQAIQHDIDKVNKEELLPLISAIDHFRNTSPELAISWYS